MSHHQQIFERSQKYGVEALSTAELFTLILCGNGAANTKQREKALQLIQHLLAERNNGFAVLSTDIHEMFASEFDDQLAYRLVALLELHHRLTQPATERLHIRQPADAARLLMATMSHLKIEQIRVLVLNAKNDLVLNRMISQGTVNSSVLRAAEVYRPAVVRNCPAIILCHNHPSGDPAPSPKDRVQVNRYFIGIHPETGFFINPELFKFAENAV